MNDEKTIIRTIEKVMLGIPDRPRDILEKRFGLKKNQVRKTLELIGQEYGVTRERIRQIENSAKELVLGTEILFKEIKKISLDLEKVVNNEGGIMAEKDLMNYFSEDVNVHDYINFILNLSESFVPVKSSEFNDKIWYTNEDSYDAFLKSLNKLYKNIKTEELLTETEILNRFLDKLSKQTINKKLLKNDVVKRLMLLSKKIGSNDLDQWGKTESNNIFVKGVRDCSFLILNKLEEPLHFKEITKQIFEIFGRKVNSATVHNELIKDDRFILVGRGQYGLKSWNRFDGRPVKKVIISLLEKSKKALTKKEIIEKVLEKKKVRKQTVVINLSNKIFCKNKDGTFFLRKS